MLALYNSCDAITARRNGITHVCNGVRSHTVSIAAGCAQVHIGPAVIIGCFSSYVYFCVCDIFERKNQIHHVLDAFAVHRIGGLWGTSESIPIAGYTDDSLINSTACARFVWLTIVNMTTLLCILRHFDELRATLVVEDSLDSSQTGVFAVFCFERVTQSKIVNAENVALPKAAKKNTLRRESKQVSK